MLSLLGPALTGEQAALFDLSTFLTPVPEFVQVFASGANRESDIRGFVRLGIPVGVSVNHLNRASVDALIELGQPVMVDSGAFSEVAVTPNGLQTKMPITGTEWKRRLALYLRLASAFGEQATLVVPDKVGDQRETLRRLANHREELAVIARRTQAPIRGEKRGNCKCLSGLTHPASAEKRLVSHSHRGIYETYFQRRRQGRSRLSRPRRRLRDAGHRDRHN